MEWRDVVGYEGMYMVSDSGDIKSLDRTINVSRRGKGHKSNYRGMPIKKIKHRLGYVQYSLSNNGVEKFFMPIG